MCALLTDAPFIRRLYICRNGKGIYTKERKKWVTWRSCLAMALTFCLYTRMPLLVLRSSMRDAKPLIVLVPRP